VPIDAATWIALVQLFISLIGIGITVWLALIVQRSTTRIAQLEFNRALRDSWMHVDEMTVQDPALLQFMNRFQPPHGSADPDFEKKRHFLFIYLNPLYTSYQAARQGLSSGARDQTIATIKSQLTYVVADDDAYWVTQNQGYDPDFAAFCREVRAELPAKTPS
jgi:hypothetical protein